MADLTPFWPTTAEGWSTFAANGVTILGAITLVVVVNISFGIVIYWQRRSALANEAALTLQDHAYKAAPRPSDATLAILNAVLDWRSAHARYKDGLSPEAVRALNRRQRQEYDLWVSRLLAAFDLILLDTNAKGASDVQATIKSEIAKHAAILRTPWPFLFVRFPVSPLLLGIIRDEVGHTRI
jgi:hypothetical protein